ncbi:hypothetical protein QFW01_003351 [Escherichia coli]|nr:hypothetical protein [Escherichia coli]
MKITNTNGKDSTIIPPMTDNNPTVIEKQGVTGLLNEIITKKNHLNILQCQNQNIDELAAESISFYNEIQLRPGVAKLNTSPVNVSQYMQLANTCNDTDSLNQSILLANNSANLVEIAFDEPELKQDLTAQLMNLCTELTGLNGVYPQLKLSAPLTKNHKSGEQPSDKKTSDDIPSESLVTSSYEGILSSFSTIPAKINQGIIDLFLLILKLSITRLVSELKMSNELCQIICAIAHSRCDEMLSQAQMRFAEGMAKGIASGLAGGISLGLSCWRTFDAKSLTSNLDKKLGSLNELGGKLNSFRTNLNRQLEGQNIRVREGIFPADMPNNQKQLATKLNDITDGLSGDLITEDKRPKWTDIETKLHELNTMCSTQANDLRALGVDPQAFAAKVKALSNSMAEGRIIIRESSTSISNEELAEHIRETNIGTQARVSCIDSMTKALGEICSESMELASVQVSQRIITQLETDQSRTEQIMSEVTQRVQQIVSYLANILSLMTKALDSDTRNMS